MFVADRAKAARAFLEQQVKAQAAMENRRGTSSGTPFILGLILVFAALGVLGLLNRVSHSRKAAGETEEAVNPLPLETPASPAWNRMQAKVDTLRQARIAAEEGRQNDVTLLLQQGFEVDSDIGRHQTMLMLACKRGRLAAARYLIRHHAKVSAIDLEGNTPLSFAAGNGHTAIVDLLLTADPSQSIDEPIGRGNATPLTLAAQNGYAGLAKYLVTHHAKIEARDRYGNTPLMTAVNFGHADIVRYLLSRQADVNARNRGYTALHNALARQRSYLESERYRASHPAVSKTSVVNKMSAGQAEQRRQDRAAAEIVSLLKKAGATD